MSALNVGAVLVIWIWTGSSGYKKPFQELLGCTIVAYGCPSQCTCKLGQNTKWLVYETTVCSTSDGKALQSPNSLASQYPPLYLLDTEMDLASTEDSGRQDMDHDGAHIF